MREARHSGRTWIVAALFGCAIALAFAVVFVMRDAGSSPVPAQFEISTSQAGGDLVFHWNSAEPALAAARTADVLIDDGPHSTQLVLLPAQIAGGSIQYSPYTKDVAFRLVAHAGYGRSAQESIRVLGNAAAVVMPAHDPGTVTILVAPGR